jgi:16S rRNA (adenine1518-N6/adenine1519-N6)-dimethyltransferase
MQTLSDIKALLALHNLAPSHALGQNFLIDQNLLTKLIDTAAARAALTEASTVLEIGPGTGVLTEAMLARGWNVIACELDAGMCRLLRARLGEPIAAGRLTIVEGDCLASRRALSDPVRAALGDARFTLIANLPYGAASPVMAICAADRHCLGQFVTIQKEVGERLRAPVGTRDYGELTVMVRAFCAVERIATLRPECFWPRPTVTSEMVAITPLPTPIATDAAILQAMCHRLFTQRRKQIGAILGRDFPFPAGIDPAARPEALDIAQLVALAHIAQPSDAHG